jgi:hypothetical protein
MARSRFASLVGSILLLFLPAAGASAQNASCSTIELGMNVVLRNGKNVQGLTAQNLTGQTKRDAVAIESLSFDTSPRRILLVLDMGHNLNADARKAQLEIASYLLNGARETDSFALLTARGTLREVGFGQSRDAILTAINELHDKKAGPSTNHSILDAVSEGIGWFQNPRPGDAIILMASEIEQNKSAQFSQVVNALAKNHIRLFSFAFGPILAGTYMGPLQPGDGWAFIKNEENLNSLTWNSGGYMVVEDAGDPWKEYKLTDAHLKEVLETAARMYIAIAAFYRMSVRVPAGLKHREPWKLDLTADARNKVPYAYVAYPRFLEPCVAVASATAQ